MQQMMLGAIAMASLVAALFFLNFWRSTKDRFFLLFALAFSIEAVNRVLLGLVELPETLPAIYAIRFVSYSLILLAILDKNRTGKPAERSQP